MDTQYTAADVVIITKMECETSRARALLERMLLTACMEPIKLPLSLLQDITNNFSDDQLIGSGGFAHVYKVLFFLKEIYLASKKANNRGFTSWGYQFSEKKQNSSNPWRQTESSDPS
jgi:hypothetical protein